jgi:hypothetical protein
MSRFVRKLLPPLLVVGASATLRAQSIVCPNVPPTPKLTDCTVPAVNGSATVVIRVVQDGKGLSGQTVALTSPHSNSLPASIVTNSDGIAAFAWAGNIGTGADTITARTTRIVVAATQPGTANTITAVKGDGQYWFQSQQLRHAVTTLIGGPSQTDCLKTLIVFKAIGDGTNSPDSARAAYYDAVGAAAAGYPAGAGCYANSWWKLGTTVGDQHLRASTDGATPVTFTAHARALPWLAVGLVLSRMGGYDSVVFDSSAMKKRVVGAGHTGTFTPLFAINFPPYYKWEHIRASIGASLTHPDRDWFAGLSILQMGFGLNSEALGMDAQVGWHFSKKSVARDAVGCTATGACDVKTVLTGGPAVVIQANGSSLLSTLLAAVK